MNIEELDAALCKGGHHLGDLVYWSLTAATLEHATLERIWDAAKLARGCLPDPPTAEKALKAAVREAAVGQPDRLIRLGKEEELEIVFAVVR